MTLPSQLTHIVNHRGKVLCYSSGNERASSGYFDESGQFQRLNATIGPFGAWSHAVDCGAFVLMYHAESGAAKTVAIGELGEATTLQNFALARWTHLVVSNGLLFCYNRDSRSGCVGSFTEAGQYAEIAAFRGGELPFWTHLTGCDKFLLAYSQSDGSAATVHVSAEGQVKILFEYRFSGWDFIASQNRRLYFRNASLDVTTTGFLDFEGKFHQQITLPTGTVSDWTHIFPISRLSRNFSQGPSSPIVFENEVQGSTSLLFYDAASGSYHTSRLDNAGALLPLASSYALAPPFSEAIGPTYTYFRENVKLDSELLELLDDENVTGRTVLIGATKIEIEAGTKFLLKASRLVLVADIFVGFEGAEVGCLNPLDLVLRHGDRGADGVRGEAYDIPENARDGAPGSSGGPGSEGWSRQPMVVLVKHFDLRGSVLFSAAGVEGGRGGDGGSGGNGGDGSRGVNIDGVLGSAGGPGGPGGRGGNGGRGGVIKLLYCKGSPPLLDVKGRPGGAGGSGGAPGRNGINCRKELDGRVLREPRAARGAKGADGSPGPNGSAELLRVGADRFEYILRSLLDPTAIQQWGDYRVRVGLHYYRSFVNSDETKDYLDRALREFEGTLALSPSHQQATLYRDMIVSNLTVVGLPNDYEIRPNFEKFATIYNEWWDRIQKVRDAAARMIEKVDDRSWGTLELESDIALAQGQLAVVNRLQELTRLKLVKANERVAQATAAHNKLVQRIDQMQTELSLGTYQDSRGRFLGSFFEVVSKIAGVASPHAGAVAKLPKYIIPYWFAKDIPPEKRSAFLSDWKQGGKEAKELIEQYKELAKDAAEKGEATELVGGLVGVIEQTVKFVDRNVLTDDIRKSQVQNEIKRLAEEAARVNFDLADQLLERQQVELEVAAVKAQNDLWVKDRELAESIRIRNEEAIKQFTECGEILLRRAQAYFDNLNLLLFWSVRAFDIYMLSEVPRWTDFSNGFPHPDVHENAFLPLRRGDGTNARRIFNQLIKVSNELPGTFDKMIAFLEYHEDLGSYEITKRITEPEMISQLRSTGEIVFAILAEDLGRLLYAVRVDNIQIVLLGATMAVRSTYCILTHLGHMTVRRTQTDVFEQSLKPHSALVATFAAMNDATFSEDTKFEFFGRSPEAEWRLVVAAKPDDEVNLDGLSEIQIVLDCVGKTNL